MIVSLAPSLSYFDCSHTFYYTVPEVYWERLEYAVDESEGKIEVCAQLLGTLKDEVEVHVSTTDITAVGKSNKLYSGMRFTVRVVSFRVL